MLLCSAIVAVSHEHAPTVDAWALHVLIVGLLNLITLKYSQSH